MTDEQKKGAAQRKAEPPKKGAPKEEERRRKGGPATSPLRKPEGADRKRGEEKKEAEEEEEDEEEQVRKPKPDLSHEQARLLKVRKERSASRPEFLRQDARIAYRLLRSSWRKPRGLQSQRRQHEAQRVNVVSVGYRGPAAVRDLHASGFEEVLVASAKELKGLDPKRQAVRIRSGVGRRKRETIEDEVEDLGLWLLNPKMGHYVVKVKDPSQIVEFGLTAKGDRKRPGGDAVLIDPSVTEGVREYIIAEAEDRGIRVLNPGSGRR